MKKKLALLTFVVAFVTSISVFIISAAPPIPSEAGWEQVHRVTLNGIEYCCVDGDEPWCTCINCVEYLQDCPN